MYTKLEYQIFLIFVFYLLLWAGQFLWFLITPTHLHLHRCRFYHSPTTIFQFWNSNRCIQSWNIMLVSFLFLLFQFWFELYNCVYKSRLFRLPFRMVKVKMIEKIIKNDNWFKIFTHLLIQQYSIYIYTYQQKQ